MSKILILDNYDSFTYNLVQYFEELTGGDIDVYRNDKIKLEDVDRYDTIVFSPGPGLPEDAGLMLDIIQTYKNTKKILGVCLGHQALGLSFGGKLHNLDKVYHGIKEKIHILDSSDPLYKGIGESTEVGKYHSWVITPETLPKELIVTSRDEHGNIMSIRHSELPMWGVQYHPESIMTDDGYKMIRNFINIGK